MEEKKLTDEEIVKALDICYNSPCCSADCPYFNKNGRNFCVEDKALYKDMKLIVQEHAEQRAEIEKLLCKNAELEVRCEGILKDYYAERQTCDEQKAEIERLTGENEAYKEVKHIDIINELSKENAELQKEIGQISQSYMEVCDINAKLTEENGWLSKECNKTTTECAELQKQVDELTKIIEIREKEMFEVVKDCQRLTTEKEQAVKDTAKEIIRWIKLNGILEYCGYVIHDSTIEQMCKKFGVEVE